MKTASKRKKKVDELVDKDKKYDVGEAVGILKKQPKAGFDESVDISVKLAKKPVQAEQQIRTTIALPQGTGKKVKVLVFVRGENEKKAKEAGADYAGADEYIEKIKGGWLDFDVAIATPDMMKEVGKLGKILGTKGLMPNPKSGTVTPDPAKAVKEFKAGKTEYRTNKEGVVNLSVGKISFSEEALKENVEYFITNFVRLPALSTKGQYIRSMNVSTTMGAGVPLEFKKYL